MGDRIQLWFSTEATEEDSAMKTLLAILLLIVSATTTAFADDDIFPDDNDTVSDVHETEDQFDDEFGIMVANKKEYAEEAKRLKKEEAQINEENKKFAEGKASFQEKLNPWSDLSMKEYLKEKTGVVDPNDGYARGLYLPPESERINTPEEQADLDALYAEDRGRAPRSYSSYSYGWVTKVRSQGECGSCAAFAVTALHETCMAKAISGNRRISKKYTANLDLSEQYVVDCGYNGRDGNGCHGAWPKHYTEFFLKNGGTSPHESSYPYLNTNPLLNCNKGRSVRRWNSGAKVVKVYNDMKCNEAKLKDMVYKLGAVTVAIWTANDGFRNYKSGVMDYCYWNSGPRVDHAVTVVGYGTEKGQDYWLVKNSWGANWGLHGYIKMARRSEKRGWSQGVGCNRIASMCSSAYCQRTGQQEYAPTTPKTTNIPAKMYCDVSRLFKNRNINGKKTFRVNGRNGKLIVSEVTCKQSKCTPTRPGPVNACAYICGAQTC